MSAELQMPVMKPEPDNGNRKRRTSRKLLALLVVFFIAVLAVVFFRSSLSKVSDIRIEGNELMASDRIGQASQVAIGDQYFGISAGRVAARVKALGMIESVSVSKHFPGQVTIAVKEYPRVAFQLAGDGTKSVLLADGSVVPDDGRNLPLDRPILSGWRDDDPWKKKLCQTLSQIPGALLSDISEIKPEPTAAYEDKIRMYTRSKFEVVTTVTWLPDRIPYLGVAVNTMKEKNMNAGVITMMEQTRAGDFATESQAGKDAGAGDTATPKPGASGSPKTSSTPKPTPTPSPSGKPTPTPTPKPSAKGSQ